MQRKSAARDLYGSHSFVRDLAMRKQAIVSATARSPGQPALSARQIDMGQIVIVSVWHQPRAMAMVEFYPIFS